MLNNVPDKTHFYIKVSLTYSQSTDLLNRNLTRGGRVSVSVHAEVIICTLFSHLLHTCINMCCYSTGVFNIQHKKQIATADMLYVKDRVSRKIQTLTDQRS